LPRLMTSVRNDSGTSRAHDARDRFDHAPAGSFVPTAERAARVVPVTVLVPAYNEGATLADTLISLLTQTVAPAEILVIDDCSTDNTASVAKQFGVTVVRPPANTGSKAGAQTFALGQVTTPFVMAIDADTTLALDAIERLMPAFEDPTVVAACGSVIPRRIKSIWERGRYVEYLFAFTFYKRVQDAWGAPMIASGCFSMYRADALRAVGGWSTRTLAEDMDLTWTFYERGAKVRFIPGAVSYPLEPHNFNFLSKQLRRWSHGFVQNVRVHRKTLLAVPFLRHAVAVAFWDAIVAAAAYLVALPLLAITLGNPWLLLGYVIDIPAVAVPVLIGAAQRGEVGRALVSLPAFFVLRSVNAMFFLKAAWLELVLKRSFTTYEKGH
jgi:cellulose synthase/poly-beta-1,6-N-acetylglucosamine synthase-like glycosyltransferase